MIARMKQEPNYPKQLNPSLNLFCRCLLPLALAAVWAGCKQETAKVATETDPVGNYALISVDGNKVPGTINHEGTTLTVKSGVMAFNADGTCISRSTFALPSQPDVNRTVKATYTREGSSLTMKWEGAGVTTGKVEGDTFTMNNEGMIFVYRK